MAQAVDPGSPARAASKGERTRSRLLELAVERFGANGFRATSVSEIARAAGVTQAAVYAYFANKEALFEAAVDADAEALVQQAEAQVDDALPLRDRLVGMLLHLIDGLEQHRLAHRVLAGREPEVLGRLVDLPVLQRLSHQLAHDLRAAQAEGRLAPGVDPALVAEGLETIVLALLLALVQAGDEPRQLREPAVLAVFDALLAPQA